MSKKVNYIITVDETWIYYYDVPTKSQRNILVYEGEENPTQARKSRSVGKGMMVGFFGKRDVIKMVMLEHQKTVTAKWYTETCLPRLMETLSNLRPELRMDSWFLHLDNTPAHRAHTTTDFLKKPRIKILNHPPYNPYLAPWTLDPLHSSKFS